MSSSLNIGSIAVYRLLALIAAMAILGFHWIQGDAWHGGVSLAERAALASVFALYAAGTWTSGAVRRHAADLFEVLLYVVGVWTVRVATHEGFTADQVLALLIGLFAIGLIFRTARRLAVFHVFMLGAVTLAMQLVEPKEVEPILVISTLAVLALVSLVVATTRDHARRELEELSLVASEVHGGVVLADPSGVVQWVNAGFSRLSGLAAREALGRPLLELFSAPDGGTGLAELRSAIAQQRAVEHVEVAHGRPDGELTWVAVDLTPIKGDDNAVQRLVAIETDIGRARAYVERLVEERLEAERALSETEKQLRQAQKMEAVGRLAGGVAHDFNNLLSVVLGYSEQAIELASDDRTLRRALGEIHAASSRGAALTRQLLAFSRQQVLDPRVLDLHDALRSMEEMLRRLLGEDVDVVLDLRAPRSLVRVDEGQLTQVLLNLAVNARDAMLRGGRLTVETDLAELDEAWIADHPGLEPGAFVVLAVTDTGHGMDESTQARIFEPFFTTKEQGKGTGLGLSTIFGIVKQSGGAVDVRSEPGAGTTFRVYLPIAEGEVDRPFEQAGPAGGGTERLLLVEDEDALRDLTRGILERAGYTVATASRGDEAIERSESGEPIEVLVTDIVLPGGSGVELAAELRRRRGRLPVVFMSGYTPGDLPGTGLSEGAVFLQKPFTPAALRGAVRRALDAPSAGA